MSIFEKREKAFEAKFALDNENSFKSEMNAYSRLAFHIAKDMLHFSDKSAQKYADKVVSLKIKHCDRQAVFNFILKKLEKHHITLSHNDLDKMLSQRA